MTSRAQRIEAAWKPGVIRVRMCRQSGTVVTVTRGEMRFGKVCKWLVQCEDHGCYHGYQTQRDALFWASRPRVWCYKCQALAREESGGE